MIPILALGGLGALALLLRGADHEQGGAAEHAPGYIPPGYVPPTEVNPALLSCEAALTTLATMNPESKAAAAQIRTALEKSVDAAALEKAATGIEMGASTPGLTAGQRAAALRVAQCLRDRASLVKKAGKAGELVPDGATGTAVTAGCDTALGTLAAMNPESAAMAKSVRAALMLSNDKKALGDLATGIAMGASTPGLTAAQHDAALAVAQCLRDKAGSLP